MMSSLVKLHILHHSTPPPPHLRCPGQRLKKRERHTKNYNLFIGWLRPEKKKKSYLLHLCMYSLGGVGSAENPETRMSFTQPGPHGVRFSLSFPVQPDSEQELKRRASLWTFASLKQPWNVEEKRLIERNRGAVNVGEPHWSPCISLVDFGVRPVWIRLKIYDRFTICLSVAERFSLLHPRWKAIFFSFLTLTAGVCSPPTLQLRPALCIDPSHCKQLF